MSAHVLNPVYRIVSNLTMLTRIDSFFQVLNYTNPLKKFWPVLKLMIAFIRAEF